MSKKSKSARRGIRKYTAFVPKTARAATNLGKKAIHGATSVLNGAVRIVRQGVKSVDKTTARVIRSLSLRRGNKQSKRGKTHKKGHKSTKNT